MPEIEMPCGALLKRRRRTKSLLGNDCDGLGKDCADAGLTITGHARAGLRAGEFELID